MGKDLGTYYLRVEFMDGRGWIDAWRTGWRYTGGTERYHPLGAIPIPPPFENEEELFRAMYWQYTEGNYSCDCNKGLLLAYAEQREPPWETPCGDTMPLRSLKVVRPDRTEVVFLEEERKLS